MSGTPKFPDNWQFPMDSNYVLNADVSNYQGWMRHNPLDPSKNLYNPGWFYEAKKGTPVYLLTDKPAGMNLYKYTSRKYGICCMVQIARQLWINYFSMTDVVYELEQGFLPMGTLIGHSGQIDLKKGEWDYNDPRIANTPELTWCISTNRVDDNGSPTLIDPREFAGYPLPIDCRYSRTGKKIPPYEAPSIILKDESTK